MMTRSDEIFQARVPGLTGARVVVTRREGDKGIILEQQAPKLEKNGLMPAHEFLPAGKCVAPNSKIGLIKHADSLTENSGVI
jgi:hypothetical protein